MQANKKHNFKTRIVDMCRSILLIAIMLCAALIIATLIIGIRLEHSKYPALLGSHPQNIKRLQSDIDPDNFSFIVMGDVKDSTPTFKSLLDIAKKENPAFILILGDLVNHANIQNHKLFAKTLAPYASEIPFLVLPGNHDLTLDGRFGINQFEQLYGPANFSFSIGQNLFIVLNDIDEYNLNREYLTFLENTLSKKGSNAKKIFIFTHIPVSGLNDSIKGSGAPYSSEFTDILNKYHVDYVFAGDHHAFIKTVKDNTTYIISGGGGSRLRGTQGRFHHFVEININDGKVYEDVFTGNFKHSGFEVLERNIVVYLWKPVSESKTLFALSVLYCLIAALTIPVMLRRKRT